MTVTKAEREVLKDVNAAARKAFKSKPTLKLLGALSDKGLISFDPFTQTASLTEAGHAAVQ